MKVILIGGTSHVGKSTLAKHVAGELGWGYLSTDQFARHPGRPWRDDNQTLPDDVVVHYSNANTNALVDEVLTHYRQNVWPIVEAVVQSHLQNSYDPNLVLEGSAILPEKVQISNFDRVAALWLTAPDELIEGRIRANSQYATRTEAEKQRINAFSQRSVVLNGQWQETVAANGQLAVDVSREDPTDRFMSILNE